jgi:hypothetical protein
VFAAVALAAVAARAQAPHPIPPPRAALHQLAAEADVVVTALVSRVEEGRIQLTARAALRGQPPAVFELKRSPLRPPPLAIGDRVLLFLRGARSPYVLVGEPKEVMRIANDADEAAFRALLPKLLAAGSDPQSLAALYAGWLADGPAALRVAAASSLLWLPSPPP